MIYKDYLKTNHWKNLRSKKYKKKNRACAICRYTSNLETHHLNYKNLYDVNTTDLRVFCRGCHSLLHRLMSEGLVIMSNYRSHHAKMAVAKNVIKKYKKIEPYKTFWYKKRTRQI